MVLQIINCQVTCFVLLCEIIIIIIIIMTLIQINSDSHCLLDDLGERFSSVPVIREKLPFPNREYSALIEVLK